MATLGRSAHCRVEQRWIALRGETYTWEDERQAMSDYLARRPYLSAREAFRVLERFPRWSLHG